MGLHQGQSSCETLVTCINSNYVDCAVVNDVHTGVCVRACECTSHYVLFL